MRRIAIGPDRIRCSLPGFDVLTASMRQMAYDSRFASIGLAERGSLPMKTRNISLGWPAPDTETVLFSRDFGTPPIFDIGRIAQRGSLTVFVPSWTIVASDALSQSQKRPIESYPVAQVRTDRFLVTNYTNSSNTYYRNTGPTLVKWLALA